MGLKIADFFVGAFSGALVAWVVSHIPLPFTPMLLGGLTGMLLVIPLKILLMPLFGAFEVMIPLAIIGMTVGMGAAMLSTATAPSTIVIAFGALTGLLVATIVYFSNKRYTSL